MSETAAILAADDRRRTAMVAGDIATLDAVFADQFLYLHSNGMLDDKRAYISRISNGVVRYDWARTENVGVILHDDCAVLNGTAAMKYERLDNGNGGIITTLFVATWIKQDDCWQLAAYASVAKHEQ